MERTARTNVLGQLVTHCVTAKAPNVLMFFPNVSVPSPMYNVLLLVNFYVGYVCVADGGRDAGVCTGISYIISLPIYIVQQQKTYTLPLKSFFEVVHWEDCFPIHSRAASFGGGGIPKTPDI